MVVGFTTTYAMSCEFEPYSWRGVPPPIKPTAPIWMKYCWKWR